MVVLVDMKNVRWGHKSDSFFFQVLDIVNPNTDGSGPLNLNIVARKDESSSWVQEEGRFVSRKSKSYQVISGSGCVYFPSACCLLHVLSICDIDQIILIS